MLANGRKSRSAQLDAKYEAWKYGFQVALNLGSAAVPAIASGEGIRFTLRVHHHDRILVGLRLGDTPAHDLIEHLREELVAQIIAVESNSCKSFRSSFFVYRREDRNSLINAFIAARRPSAVEVIRCTLLLQLGQFLCHVGEIDLEPSSEHSRQILGLLVKA